MYTFFESASALFATSKRPKVMSRQSIPNSKIHVGPLDVSAMLCNIASSFSVWSEKKRRGLTQQLCKCMTVWLGAMKMHHTFFLSTLSWTHCILLSFCLRSGCTVCHLQNCMETQVKRCKDHVATGQIQHCLVSHRYRLVCLLFFAQFL